MPIVYLLGILAVLAYVVQGLLGFRQIKHFTAIYGEMKAKGRVAIGRKSGKFRAGTIVMFTIDEGGVIIDSRKIQGTTVLAKFKELAGFTGIRIVDLSDRSHCVLKENRLTQQTILDAVSVYQRVADGEEIKVNQPPFQSFYEQVKLGSSIIQAKMKRSVNK